METKEVELAKREEELSTKIRLLENQKNILIKESKSLENEAKKRKAEYDIEEKKFMKLAVEETKELEKLDAEINLEHNRETETLVQMLSDEATSIMQQFKSQGSNSSTEIALDAESVEHQLQSMTIQAGTSAEQIQKDLLVRHEKMRARTLARNERRQTKLAEKLNEQAREVREHFKSLFIGDSIKILITGSLILLLNIYIFSFFSLSLFLLFVFFFFIHKQMIPHRLWHKFMLQKNMEKNWTLEWMTLS